MKTFKRILLGIAFLLLLLFVIALFLPSRLYVERKMEIKAPVAVVFEQFNTLRNWEKWSPWIKIDPGSERYYFGPESGVGAGYTWKGKKIGDGKLTITESQPFQSIVTELEMRGQRVYPGFHFEEKEGVAHVTWYFASDAGLNPFRRYMNRMIEGMLGHQFEQGLAAVKHIAESMPLPEPPLAMEEVMTDTIFYLSVRDTATAGTIHDKRKQVYNLLEKEIVRQQLKKAGAPFSIFHSYSEEFVDVEMAVPVDRSGRPTEIISAGMLPAGRHLVAHFFGSYENTHQAHQALIRHVQEKGLTINGLLREHYVSDPAQQTDTAQWQTDIYCPIQ
jgi:effector-binding domain-containing protein